MYFASFPVWVIRCVRLDDVKRVRFTGEIDISFATTTADKRCDASRPPPAPSRIAVRAKERVCGGGDPADLGV